MHTFTYLSIPAAESTSGLTQDLQFLGIRFPSRVQGLGDSCSRTPSILPPSTNLFSSVPVHGITLLGLRSYPSGLLVPETPLTSFSFIRSDRPVYATASIRSIGPCQPSTALAGPKFSYLRNPYPHLSGGIHDFCGRFHSRVGRSHGGFPDYGYLDPYRLQTPYQLSGAQGGSLCPKALGPSAPGPPGYDRYGQFDSSFVYQQARRDPLPHLVTVDSRAVPLVRGSEHNIPSKTYSRLSERDSRPPILSEPANTNRVESPPEIENRIFGLWGTPEVDIFATVSNSHLPWFMSPIPEPRALAVDALSQDWQGRSCNVQVSSTPSAQQTHSEAPVHPGGRGNSRSPWWPKQSWFPHLLHLCVDHPLFFPYRRDLLSQQDQKYVSNEKSYRLHAWRLSCDTIKQQAFQTRSLGSPQPLGGPQPIPCKTIGGFASLDGPQGNGLIRLTPQLLR